MRSFGLVVLAVLVGACSGGDSEPAERTGLALLDVTIVDSGERRSQVFRLSEGRLSLTEGLGRRTVFSRAGSEPDRQSIVWEEVYLREADGTEQQLTKDERADLAPRLLRDGRVAFVSCVYPEDGTSPLHSRCDRSAKRRSRDVAA